MAFRNFIFVLFFVIFFLVNSETLLISAGFDESESYTNGSNCNNFLDYFANSTSNFTHCAIKHARPIKLCEMCIDYYLEVLKAHEEVMKGQDDDGHTCKSDLINLDRLEVIEGAFDYVYELWQRAHCSSCFVVKDNGTITSQLSNITIKFQELYNVTQDCFEEYHNKSSDKYDPSVCINCTEKYCDLNKYYQDLKADNGEGIVCMDIVDAMNATRTKWSKRFGCYISSPKAEIPFIVSVVLVMITPIIYYLAAKRFSAKTESRLLRQKRLAMQFNCPSTSGS